MNRRRHRVLLEVALRRAPVVVILGPRQVGKTTLAGELARRHKGPVTRFDLEDPEDLRQLGDAKLALGELRGLVILDEIQRRPDLFPVLRVLADRRPLPARFLILGSASPDLLRQGSESLAGRVHYHELTPFRLDETGVSARERLWLRGGFPRAFLARSDAESAAWRQDFIRSYLERDVPQLGPRIPAETLRRFWSMLAHYHGQIWASSEFARSFGMSDVTVRRYLDLLTSLFLARQLPPWYENIGKRLVRSPKVYVADSGLLHQLLGIGSREALLRHPKLGASWEGFALSTVETCLGATRDECYFYATHGGAELDLLVVRGTRRIGFEFKRTVAPEFTKSMRVALADLRLERLDVIHAGERTYPLAERVRAVALERALRDVPPLRSERGEQHPLC